jgi:eukaryotic-like serine/threonine-protein kinase
VLERIGNCRIIEEIGSGGMAVIYKAVQESLNRTVAIKALKTSVARESQFAIRFEREAMSVAGLSHENIIHIYDFQRLGGALFIVMEYVEGIDLYDLLDRAQPLPVDVGAIIAMQVARALDYAHYRGIIHRDIKPANIMIAKSGLVKLMDFGIARDQSFGDLTESGTGLGTPSYMSPEQILGDKLDFRSDIFSVGIVLYQMVCGKKPFIEDEHKSVMHKIRLEKYPSPRKLNPLIPRELERIMARCMRKRREDRYRSTQDLVLALERFISKRTEMNYHARLVLYLQELGVMTAEEADAYLHPAMAGGYQRREGGAKSGMKLGRLLAVQAATLAGMALATSLVHLAPVGNATALPPPPVVIVQAPAPVPSGPPGFVRVVVDPWAEVHVDGKMVDVTPIARPLALPAGKHTIELRNPYFETEAREIDVAARATQTLKVALAARQK